MPPEDVLHGLIQRSRAEVGECTDDAGGKHVFGVLPNYRIADATAIYMPITVGQKFTIASGDSGEAER